jgi:Arylsulfotransferase (ASST)/Secretion system C-terminal sorting domain
MTIRIFSFAFFLLLSIFLPAQNSTGIITWDPAQSFSGYNFFYPNGGKTAYMINDCGELINQWIDTTIGSGNVIKLDSGGTVFLAKSGGNASNPFIFAGGASDKIEERDWNNNLLWQYTINDSLQRLHHDFLLLPNGNIVVTAFERFTAAQMVAMGRDTSLNAGGELWPDMLLELQPTGANTANVVWEWHAIDHVIQDFDSTKPNYGNIASNLHRIDLNLVGILGNADWMHTNALSYNHAFNQIMLSVPNLNEIWIIDHSTTTAQAAAHTGGLSGIGGDLMYRWGNPMNYDQGTPADRKLGFQHDAHWADEGVPSTDPAANKIMVFNNRYGTNRSIVAVIDATFDDYEWEYPLTAAAWGPTSYDWTFCLPDSIEMQSHILSSAQRLPNGNTLIMPGIRGRAFEVNVAGDIVWDYIIPLDNGIPVAQGDTVDLFDNSNFRFHRYAPSHPGFAGHDLSPIGWIETNPNTGFCESILTVQFAIPSDLKLFPNPTEGSFVIQGIENSDIRIVDVTGRQLFHQLSGDTEVQVDAQAWSAGIYSVLVNGKSIGKIVKQ